MPYFLSDSHRKYTHTHTRNRSLETEKMRFGFSVKKNLMTSVWWWGHWYVGHTIWSSLHLFLLKEVKMLGSPLPHQHLRMMLGRGVFPVALVLSVVHIKELLRFQLRIIDSNKSIKVSWKFWNITRRIATVKWRTIIDRGESQVPVKKTKIWTHGESQVTV